MRRDVLPDGLRVAGDGAPALREVLMAQGDQELRFKPWVPDQLVRVIDPAHQPAMHEVALLTRDPVPRDLGLADTLAEINDHEVLNEGDRVLAYAVELELRDGALRCAPQVDDRHGRAPRGL